MTNQNDWARFCAMMQKSGVWKLVYNDQHRDVGFFTANMGAIRYYPVLGIIQPMGGKPSQVGDWRTWLEAGQTPAPF